jgi:hypothetical protein
MISLLKILFLNNTPDFISEKSAEISCEQEHKYFSFYKTIILDIAKREEKKQNEEEKKDFDSFH